MTGKFIKSRRAALYTHRFWQVLLIVSFLAFSWLMMQAVHEAGHVLMAWLTGGQVTKVVLHLLVISRTDIGENPHPLMVVWGGPIVGSLLPLTAFALAATFRWRALYLFRFFAGFCLVANGAYISTGLWLADEADPKVMVEQATPIWLLIFFGFLTVPLGLYLWHRQGKYFGLSGAHGRVNKLDALVSVFLLAIVVAVELVLSAP